jgi:triosephosphate isomerase
VQRDPSAVGGRRVFRDAQAWAVAGGGGEQPQSEAVERQTAIGAGSTATAAPAGDRYSSTRRVAGSMMSISATQLDDQLGGAVDHGDDPLACQAAQALAKLDVTAEEAIRISDVERHQPGVRARPDAT